MKKSNLWLKHWVSSVENVMNEQQQETLSALFDGEANEFETRRLLAEMDPASAAQWQHFQWIRDTAKNRLGDCDVTVSVVDAVAAIIAREPDIRSTSTAAKKDHWLKPLLGFATAASVAFVVVLGMQQFEQQSAPASTGFVANGNVSASQLQISGGVGLNPVSGSVSSSALAYEIEAIDEQKARDKDRIQYYLQQHAQHASFNNGRGLLPMARMSEEEN
jgi:sigma-E factor negative regulatory protein RseA